MSFLSCASVWRACSKFFCGFWSSLKLGRQRAFKLSLIPLGGYVRMYDERMTQRVYKTWRRFTCVLSHSQLSILENRHSRASPRHILAADLRGLFVAGLDTPTTKAKGQQRLASPVWKARVLRVDGRT